jgi:hypothetical protein
VGGEHKQRRCRKGHKIPLGKVAFPRVSETRGNSSTLRITVNIQLSALPGIQRAPVKETAEVELYVDTSQILQLYVTADVYINQLKHLFFVRGEGGRCPRNKLYG